MAASRTWARNMINHSIDKDKQMIRSAARKKRDDLPRENIARWSDEICKILQEQSFFRSFEHICFYHPLGNEVNLLPFAEKAIELGKKIFFPRVNGDDMEFYRVSGLQEFVQGAFHVMEPVGADHICAKDALVLVPGLVFDNCGRRMGYGKGYYDKYFSRNPEYHKIGVCYEMQLIPEVPCDRYDIPMDMIVTEQGIYLCDKNRNIELE